MREFSSPLDTLVFYGKRSFNYNASTLICALGLINCRLALTEHDTEIYLTYLNKFSH